MLSSTLYKTVPFYDMDAIQMVWHGNYVKYLEDARELFFKEHQLSYQQIFDYGYTIPVVDLHLQYKATSRMGDTLRIEIVYQPVTAAKINFDYTIYNQNDELVLKASSSQLFVSNQEGFTLSTPDFMRQWRNFYQV